MSDRILVPVDGSPLSKRALEVACEEHPEAEITAIHVIDPTEPGYSVYGVTDDATEPPHGSAAWYDRAEAHAADLFESLTELAAEYDVSLRTESCIGRPDREILSFAAEEGVDHIILGSHGRDEDARLLLGSVTEAVAFRAPMRVTLVR